MTRVLAILFLILAALPVRGNEIVGALSQNRVSLTANFSGSEILIFGAIRHDLDVAEESPYDVVIVIEGPHQPVDIWRKDRRMGIWMNVESVSMASVPSFYAVATSAPLDEILTPETDAEHRISASYAIRPDQATGQVEDPSLFTSALMRIRERAEQYLTLDRWVFLDRDILFRANVQLPANLTEGAYTTRMYLVRDGDVVNQFRTAIFVRKEGIERWLHQLAYDQPLAYGLLALLIALAAGWGASEAFRYLRH
ncbi:MAG: putative transmembrane protein [Rhodobacteraceae bacterium HLUCCA12]|nr:MAG: putative transmembrane protein [Rhodobacteraceae bacterium HLUCCA12]